MKKLKNIALAGTLICLLFTDCRIKLLPDRDTALAKQIELTGKMIDSLYLNIAEETVAEERTYKKYAKGYNAVEVELNSILLKNKVKALNKDAEKIAENSVTLWSRYKSKHQADNRISNADIKLNRVFMRDQVLNMLLGEKYKPEENENEN